MTFSNFKPLSSRFAEIDITTGMWWWKRTIRKSIVQIDGSWFFQDDRQWRPLAVSECEREYYGRVK